MTCKRISAQEAYRINLVNQVVPSDQVMNAALEMAERIAKLPPKSIRYTKKAMRVPLASDHHLNVVDEAWKDILGGSVQILNAGKRPKIQFV